MFGARDRRIDGAETPDVILAEVGQRLHPDDDQPGRR